MTATTKPEDRVVNNDPREAELVDEMRLDAMDYIYGRASDGILEALDKSTNTPATLGGAAYKTAAIVANMQKDNARVEMDMDMMLGLTTDIIDMLVEVAETADVLPTGSNMERLREDALLHATVIHGQTLENAGDAKGFTEEQQQAAQADMRDYMSDGATQVAFDYVNERAKAEGMNPYDMMRAGNEMALGSKHPLQEGIKKGLMSNVPTNQMPVANGPQGPVPQTNNNDAALDAAGKAAPVVGAAISALSEEDSPPDADLWGVNSKTGAGMPDRGGTIPRRLVDERANRQADLAFSAPPLMERKQ